MNYRFKTKPYKHQVRALRKLVRNRGGALFMPMRSGKTKVAIDYAGVAHLKFGVQRVLVVCPLSVIGVWHNEIRKHASITDLDWMIINYERLWDRQTYYDDDGDRHVQATDAQALYDFAPDLVIADEAHRIGDPTTVASKKIYKLQKQLDVRHKIIMTGTPVHRKIFAAFGMFKFLDDSIFGTNWGAFKSQFGLFGGYGSHTLLKYVNVSTFRAKIEPLTFNMRHVPVRAPIHQVIPVTLDDSREAYREMARDSILNVNGKVVESPLIITRLLRLAQIAGGHIKDEDGETHTLGGEKKAALSELMSQFEDADIRKVVIFCRFVKELGDIADAARTQGYKVLALHGGVDGPTRELRIASFMERKDKAVFVAQISAGSVGIDLSAADTTVFYSLSESLLDYDQACARMRKYKDNRLLTYYYLLARRTVDDLMYLSLKQKQDLADFVMNHPDLLHHAEEG